MTNFQSTLTILSVILIVISSTKQVNCGLDSLFSDGKLDKLKERECLNNFNRVKNIEQLEKFLSNLSDQLTVGFITERDATKCLRTNGHVRSEIRAFKSLIAAATKGEICKKENVEKIILMHSRLTTNNKENKEKRLAPMWEQFVRETLVTCKRSLVNKLDYEARQYNRQDHLKDILNLAQNFNWFDYRNFISDGELKLTSNLTHKSLDDVAHLVETSGKIDELLRVKNLPDYVSDEFNQASYDFVLNRDQYYRMQEMFTSCSYLLQDEIMDPVLDLVSMGYDDSETGLDNKISDYKHINVWLASFQMCHLLNYVQALIMSENGDTYRIRFKAGRHFDRDQKTESSAYLLRKDPKNIENNIHIMIAQTKYWKKLDRFTNIESAINSIRWNDMEQDKIKLLGEECTDLQRAILSKKFLEVIANFIMATDGFSQSEMY